MFHYHAPTIMQAAQPRAVGKYPLRRVRLTNQKPAQRALKSAHLRFTSIPIEFHKKRARGSALIADMRHTALKAGNAHGVTLFHAAVLFCRQGE